MKLIRGDELPEGSVTVHKPSGPEVLWATASSMGVSKLREKLPSFILEEKQKQEHRRTLGESGKKVNT